MEAERERIESARRKNLEYIRRLDEQKASREVDELLASGTRDFLGFPAGSEDARVAAVGRKTVSGVPPTTGSKGNSSVYITGLTTYMACKQLEGMCSKIGKVRRIKFYKDERGGLKGDAVVTFSSRITMTKAIDRLNHFEVKPGVIITATEAEFPGKKLAASKAVGGRSDAQVPGQVFEGSDATGTDDKQAVAQDVAVVSPAAVTLPQIALSDATASLDLPSRSIILKHIWDPLEPRDGSDAAFFDELEDDMRAECSKHGSVDRVQIVADGAVIVRFTALNAATACLQVMNGRWFAGRQIEARFDQATAEDPIDEDTKVEAFLASVGS